MTRRKFLMSIFGAVLTLGVLGWFRKANATTLVLNETGARIYKGYKEGRNAEQIASDIVAEYDVDFETALKDTRNFLSILRSMGV